MKMIIMTKEEVETEMKELGRIHALPEDELRTEYAAHLRKRWDITIKEGGYMHSLEEVLGGRVYDIYHCGSYHGKHVEKHRGKPIWVCDKCGATLPVSSMDAYFENPANKKWQSLKKYGYESAIVELERKKEREKRRK